MSDRLFFALVGIAAVALIALSLVWPQGQGVRSPAPFGHAEVEPPYVAFERKQQAMAARKAEEAAARQALVAAAQARAAAQPTPAQPQAAQ